LYASCRAEEVNATRDRLSNCAADVARWCASRRLQLNPDKTKAIWFGSRAALKKLQPDERTFQIGLYDVPRLRTKFGERAFSFSGPSARNALPADFRDEMCTATFKKKLKTFYFSLAFDCIWHRFYVTFVMHLHSYSSGGTTKFLTWSWTWTWTPCCHIGTATTHPVPNWVKPHHL